jgi:hypothetical protein
MLPHSEQKASYPDGSPILIETGRLTPSGEPQREQALALVYSATNGELTLTVRAGTKPGAKPGDPPVSLGIPYGGMARLLLVWIVTEASKRDSQTLDLGDTLSSFCKRLDIPMTGGANGRIPYLMDQIERLATCFVSYRWQTARPGRTDVSGQNLLVIDSYHFWSRSSGARAPDCRGGTLRIADDFWRQIMNSVFPLDFRKAQYFRHYPLAFDLYTFLTYRLGQMQKKRQHTLALKYDDIHRQLGSHYACDTNALLTEDGTNNFARSVRKARDVARPKCGDTQGTGHTP